MSKDWKKEFDERFGLVNIKNGDKLPRVLGTEEIKNFISKVEQQAYNRGRQEKGVYEEATAKMNRDQAVLVARQDTLKQVKDLIESKRNNAVDEENDRKVAIYNDLLKDIDNL